MYAAGGFALHPIGWLAEYEDGNVGLFCSFNGFGDGLVVVGYGLVVAGGHGAIEVDVLEDVSVFAGEQTAALGVEEAVAEALLKCCARRNHVFGIAGDGPCAEQLALAVGHGTDESDGF